MAEDEKTTLETAIKRAKAVQEAIAKLAKELREEKEE